MALRGAGPYCVAADPSCRQAPGSLLVARARLLLLLPTPTPTPTLNSPPPPSNPQPKTQNSAQPWPPKSSLYLFRTDGMSCSRELVTGSGQLRFAHPSTQQHLLVWRERPRSVMVLKKRGAELAAEFVQVVQYLGETERLRVVVEPAEYDALLLAARYGSGGSSGEDEEGDGSSASTPQQHQNHRNPHPNPLAASSRYLYTFTPQERERGLADAVDFVVCLGGDGVILHAGGLFGRSIPPLVSFHLGSMGFLTNHAFVDFRAHLRDVIYGSQRLEACASGGDAAALAAPVASSVGAGGAAMAAAAPSSSFAPPQQQQQQRPPALPVSPRGGSNGTGSSSLSSPPAPPTGSVLDSAAAAHLPPPSSPPSPTNEQKLGVMVTLRMRLECSVVRRGQTLDNPEQVYEVLNEVVVDRGADSFLTNLECRVAGRLITRVQADGVMLATASGSTAYSAAAGGSMVHPNVPAILLTPVCPHSLNFRPVVLPDYVELELRVPDAARAAAWVCFDGKHRQQLMRGDSVHVRMSPNPMPTINKADLTGDWFESLERCFRWSNRAEQKPLQEGARAGVAAEADSSTHASRDDGDGNVVAAMERLARREAEAEALARAFAAAAAAGGGMEGHGVAAPGTPMAAAPAVPVSAFFAAQQQQGSSPTPPLPPVPPSSTSPP
jgi:NAD kinase